MLLAMTIDSLSLKVLSLNWYNYPINNRCFGYPDTELNTRTILEKGWLFNSSLQKLMLYFRQEILIFKILYYVKLQNSYFICFEFCLCILIIYSSDMNYDKIFLFKDKINRFKKILNLSYPLFHKSHLVCLLVALCIKCEK